jgi:hypothetical protein
MSQFYPHGINVIYLNAFSLDAFIALPFILARGTIFAYNIVSLLSIWLSAFTAYLMSYDLLKSRLPAIFAGVAFGFGAFQFAHALGHFSIFGPFWLPLLVLALNRLVRVPSASFALLSGVLCVLACLTNGYAAIVVAFIICFYLLLWAAPRIVYQAKIRGLSAWSKSHLLTVAAVAGPLLVLLPIAFLASPNQPAWPAIEYASWGASPLDYLLPSYLHPFFGPPLLKFYASFPYGPFRWGGLLERDLYLGITPLALAFYAVIVKRDSFSTKLSLIAVGFIVLSLGPFMKVLGFAGNIEPYSLFSWMPFFRAARVIARLGLGALLFCSLISSIGMNYLLRAERIRGRRRAKIIGVILIGLVLFEIIPTIPYPLTDPALHSNYVYVWLSNQPGTFGILEYPVSYGDVDAGYHALIAAKYTTSGFVNIPPSDLVTFLASISFLQPNDKGELRPVNITLLKTLNIRYILIHRTSYVVKYGPVTLSQALEEANSTIGLRYIAVIDDTVIYEIAQPSGSPSTILCTERTFVTRLGVVD